jgi:hypothetical protein
MENIITNPEIDPSIDSQLTFEKCTYRIQWEKRVFLTNHV